MSNILPESAQAPNVGDALQRAWTALKPNIWLFLGFTFLFFLAYYLVAFLLALIPLGSLFGQLLSFIYPVSLFNAFEAADGGHEIQFGDFFRWTPRFGRQLVGALVAGLALLVVLVPLMMAFGISMLDNDTGSEYSSANIMKYWSFGFGFVGLAMLIMLLYYIATFALQFLLLKRDLPLGETLALSARTGFRNIGTLIIYGLLALGLSILGLLTCGIGLLITIPLMVGTHYFVLLAIFPDTTAAGNWDFEQSTPDTPYQSF